MTDAGRAGIALDTGADAHTPKRVVRERSSGEIAPLDSVDVFFGVVHFLLGVGIVLQQLSKFLTVVDIKPYVVAS